jgi:integrase
LQIEITGHKDQERIFPVNATALKMAWQRLLRSTEIENLHFHDLRHEAISRFFELGLTAPEVASISGHRDMRMLFRYSHPERQRVLRQLDTLHA